MSRQKKMETIDNAITNPYVRAVLDMLAQAEIGADSANGGGYDVAFGLNKRFSSYDAHPGTRESYTDKQGKKRTSTAAGRYQFLESTAKDLSKRYGFSDFSPQTQDKMAIALMMDVGALDDIMRGDIDAALPKLGKRWASLPTSVEGARLHGTRSSDFVRNAYTNALRHWANGAPVVYPNNVQPTQPTTPVTPEPLPPVPSFGLERFAQGQQSVPSFGLDQFDTSAVRDQMTRRYQRRRNYAPALTPENVRAMARMTAGPGLVSNISQIRNGELVNGMVPNGQAPVQAPQPQPQAAGDAQVLPLVAPQPQPQDQGTVVEMVLNEPTVLDNIPQVMEVPRNPTVYLEQELERSRKDAAPFLNVEALTMPYRDALLDLIDRTNVSITR